MTEQSTVNIEFQNTQVKHLSTCEAALILAGKQKDRALRLLVALSRDGDPTVRIRTAQCFMEIGEERAVMGLMELLEDPHPQVRITAVNALGSLRAHVACNRLKELLKSDPEISVRVIVARTLGKLGDPCGLALIIRLLDEDNEFFRRLAVMALKDIIGQTFSPTQEGIRSAKRYLEANLKKHIINGES